jgi:hypothetical protein
MRLGSQRIPQAYARCQWITSVSPRRASDATLYQMWRNYKVMEAYEYPLFPNATAQYGNDLNHGRTAYPVLKDSGTESFARILREIQCFRPESYIN